MPKKVLIFIPCNGVAQVLQYHLKPHRIEVIDPHLGSFEALLEYLEANHKKFDLLLYDLGTEIPNQYACFDALLNAFPLLSVIAYTYYTRPAAMVKGKRCAVFVANHGPNNFRLLAEMIHNHQAHISLMAS